MRPREVYQMFEFRNSFASHSPLKEFPTAPMFIRHRQRFPISVSLRSLHSPLLALWGDNKGDEARRLS
jgi:hypothetical protein